MGSLILFGVIVFLTTFAWIVIDPNNQDSPIIGGIVLGSIIGFFIVILIVPFLQAVFPNVNWLHEWFLGF